MKVVFFLMLLVASFYFVGDGFAQIREEPSGDSKIHPTIADWQSSSDPESFARSVNLSFSEDKISVYIHLDSEESISSLPQYIDVVSSDENIAVAFVSSSQIDQLAQLDFVERIAPPPMMAIRQDSLRETQSNVSVKIHPTIADWQSSSDPESFARSINLSFFDNKIGVYIHLDSEESISSLPQDIDVVSSDENIAVAFVSSSQIDQLAQLDFVERIAPPTIGRNPPIPLLLDDSGDIEMISAIIIGVVIAIGIGIFSVKRRRVQHT